MNTPILSDDLFHPMAPADSVPSIIRRYHYQHLPPPSNPNDFLVALRRGLRGVDEVGLWGKLKGASWRFLLKFDKHMHFEVPIRPDFPVAPPETPSVPTPFPDVHITLATSPSCRLSPPLPQEEGFLAVPIRTSRGRSAEISPSPLARPLPTPPDLPPPYSAIEAERFQHTNDASHPPTDEPLTTPDLSTNDIVAALLFAGSVVTPDEESPDHDITVGSQQRGSSDIASDTASVTASSDSASEPRDSSLTLSNTMTEGIRDVATDTEFLDELGMSAHDYMQLLEGLDFVQLNAKEEDRS